MGKVNAVKLNSASVKYDNSVDTERVYDIESNANIQGNSVISFDAGIVKKKDVKICTFSKYGNNQLNVTFNNASVEDMCAALSAIEEFVESVKTTISENQIKL